MAPIQQDRVYDGEKTAGAGVAPVAETGQVHITSDTEAQEHLENIKKQHLFDPNLPDDFVDEVADALQGGSPDAKVAVAAELMENSPYPEVRAAVRNYDDDLPANTIRAWVIGMVFATIGSALNMLFSMRAPSIIITTYVAQLLCHPVGILWSKFLPDREFKTFGIRWNLNPGPWNIKEHCLVVIMANVTFGGGAAYSTDIILAQVAYYKQNWGWGWELLITFTISMCGFGMAGLFRKFLVDPAAMIWPSTLINTTLFYALHDHSKSDPAKTNGWIIGRYKWFSIVLLCSFCWYWFPGYIAPFLSVFAFVTWIKPQSPVINQLFGGWTGVSLIPITFDWTQISGYTTSPLIFPWFAVSNTLIGVVVFFVITTIGVHYSNSFWNLYLPISDSNSYDNTAQVYNVSRIINSEYELDMAAYKAYSPLFLSTTFTLTYGVSFASITALIVHSALYNGRDIWIRWTSVGREEEDVHTRLYAKYRAVPIWWYGALFLAIFGMAMGTVVGYDSHLTWWAYIISMLIALVFFLPIGLIQGSTNVAIGLNVVTEFIIGYMQPGKPLAMMLFKAYGYMALYQGLAFTSDLKMAQYMKVPPRTVFMGQVISTIWSSVVQIAVMNWAFGAIDGICDSDQSNHFTCPGGRVYFNASVIWGLIGPQRIFGIGAIYSSMLWFFLIGAICPFISWFLARRYPRSFWKYICFPIIFGGAGMIPPATALNYLSWGVVGFAFNKLIRNRWRGWWMQYNYVTSAGLDVGLALSTILIFFTLSLTNTDMTSWWGANKALNTMDYQDTAIVRTLAPGETFGPTSW
ncbi:Small oligopeptide transporter, OPT family [Pleurostoma richardsiae]|uniref:Small oligopeptide transporter, OPT family n=1 Tax=Pleurostoma richardsiae TaxID=41990 RepID=A0AA38RSE4_9PEZI|nr:Small oligopeptide transporter, OPT family [Pleurostoma richardsiae]